MNFAYTNSIEWMTALSTACAWTTHAEEYETVYKNFDWFKNQDKMGNILKSVNTPFRYQEIVPQHGMNYRGYFQSYKYFDKDFVRERFAPADHVADRVNAYSELLTIKNCFIHVRRGNYVTLPNSHPVQDIEFYNEAITFMRDNHVERFIVFSDDIAWCKESFVGDEFMFIQDTDYVEMFLMSRCDNAIIANSSFSFWGAMLGVPEHVIAPNHSRWFGSKYPKDMAMDICPPEWIKI